jgi:hypothetical protein
MNPPKTNNSVIVDIPAGIVRPMVAVLLTVIVGNVLFLFHAPGASAGVFAIFLGILILCTRNTLPQHLLHFAAFGLLIISSLQSFRFISLSNFIVLIVLLLSLSGHSAHTGMPTIWMRWLEGILSITRPIGALFTFGGLKEQRPPSPENQSSKLKYLLSLVFPVVIVLIVFGFLLGRGNAVLGKLNSTFFSNLGDYLSQIELPGVQRIVAWGVFAGVCLIIACPPNPTTLSERLGNTWHQLGGNGGKLRLHQWLASLVALNLLFLFSNIIDVLFLWSSKVLPAGISHSEYVHHGVYALIATTLLSAFLMALLTQHTDLVGKHRFIRSLAFVWMVQNLVLISGVYIRLSIYVEAYGHTPKRAYVALFLGLVILGYSLLGWAILKFKTIKWLIATNLILLFGYFSVLQFVDIPKWVTHQNINLYAKGEIKYPPDLFFKQVGSHSIPYLISIFKNPHSQNDLQSATRDLEEQSKYMTRYNRLTWRSYQKRESQNYIQLRNFHATYSRNGPNQN